MRAFSRSCYSACGHSTAAVTVQAGILQRVTVQGAFYSSCYSAGGHSTVPLYLVPEHENSHGVCLEDAGYLYDKATVHGKRQNNHPVYRSDSLNLAMYYYF
jgi:hypothetical protein